MKLLFDFADECVGKIEKVEFISPGVYLLQGLEIDDDVFDLMEKKSNQSLLMDENIMGVILASNGSVNCFVDYFNVDCAYFVCDKIEENEN